MQAARAAITQQLTDLERKDEEVRFRRHLGICMSAANLMAELCLAVLTHLICVGGAWEGECPHSS
jgi:hypothetical protein